MKLLSDTHFSDAMLSVRTLCLLSVFALIVTYALTLHGFSHVKEATFEELLTTKEGEWRNVCGKVAAVKIYETAAFLSFEDSTIDVTLFKNNFEDVHVNELREHDFLCIIGNVDSYQGKKTFTARRLGYLTE